MTLTGGSLLATFQGKRVYQPIWQIIYIYCPPGVGRFGTQSGANNRLPSNSGSQGNSQMLLSDGRNLTYHVALHPQCSITFQKSQWKNKNSGRSVEDIVSTYRFPYIKVIDFVVKNGDNTTIIFLSKLKLMGWEKSDKMPDILRTSDVEVVLGSGEVVLRSREGLESFEDGPVFDICDSNENENDLKYETVSGGNTKDTGEYFGRSYKPDTIGTPDLVIVTYTQDELISGDLAPLGPNGLNILTLCPNCQLLTYQSDSQTTSFKPPARSLRDNMADILPVGGKANYEFCSCDEENDQFRKEFQNKCMVVNQDSGSDKKVQCILVSKDQQCQDHTKDDQMTKIVSPKEKNSVTGMMTKGAIIPIGGRVIRVSGKLRLCERCGVEETQMSACKHCAKVWYCSPACKKADVKEHATVCRAYITVRRYCEEKEQFAKKLREPEDGCGTCGFWRDTLDNCTRCGQVSYCSYKCKDKSSEKHRPVCEAFLIVSNYRKRLQLARSQEVD